MTPRKYTAMLIVALAVNDANAQEALPPYSDLKPYFVSDADAVTVPHMTYVMLVGPVADSVMYNGTWRSDKPTLFTELIRGAADRQRSALFDLRFIGDNVNIDMITDLSRGIVDAHRSAPIDTAVTKCFIHVVFPPSPIAPRPDEPAAVKVAVHINADGSLQLDGRATALAGLGGDLVAQGVTLVLITADKDARVQALTDLLSELAAHKIKAVLDKD